MDFITQIVKTWMFASVLISFPIVIWANSLASSKQVEQFHEIIRQFETVAQHELELVPKSSGGGVHETIEAFYFTFSFAGQPSIDEARILQVRACELLLKTINETPGARNLYVHYPFPVQDISVYIEFRARGDLLNQDALTGKSPALVCVNKGIVKYKNHHPTQYIFETILEEPFEEAAKIVHQGEADHASGGI